jgi:hypothetical protein
VHLTVTVLATQNMDCYIIIWFIKESTISNMNINVKIMFWVLVQIVNYMYFVFSLLVHNISGIWVSIPCSIILHPRSRTEIVSHDWSVHCYIWLFTFWMLACISLGLSGIVSVKWTSLPCEHKKYIFLFSCHLAGNWDTIFQFRSIPEINVIYRHYHSLQR